jgi:catechol 2,3-dioxygenase-like lactoylglutathione lyase family enzyme
MRKSLRLLALSVACLAPWMLAATSRGMAASDAQVSEVLRPLLITHVVGDLDKSLHFFHDGVGLAFASPPGPLADSVLLTTVRAQHPEATARAATLIIPGASFQLQLVQFMGADGKPFSQHLYDAGISRLSVSVRDIYKEFNQLSDLGVTVDTTSNGPVYTQRPRNNTQAVMLHDPDGFVLELVQQEGQAHGPEVPPGVPADSNIYNARSSLGIDDINKSVAFYRDLLGFKVPRLPMPVNDAVLALEGTPRAIARSAPSMPPGSNNMWVLWNFSGLEDRLKHAPNVQDPGAAVVTFQVIQLPKLVKQMKAQGVEFVTKGVVPLGGHRRAALIRSPDGLLVALVE